MCHVSMLLVACFLDIHGAWQATAPAAPGLPPCVDDLLAPLLRNVAPHEMPQQLDWNAAILREAANYLVLPETIKMFDYSVFEFPFPGIIWGVYELRIYFSGRFISGVRISGFEFCFWRIMCCMSEFRISNFKNI